MIYAFFESLKHTCPMPQIGRKYSLSLGIKGFTGVGHVERIDAPLAPKLIEISVER